MRLLGSLSLLRLAFGDQVDRKIQPTDYVVVAEPIASAGIVESCIPPLAPLDLFAATPSSPSLPTSTPRRSRPGGSSSSSGGGGVKTNGMRIDTSRFPFMSKTKNPGPETPRFKGPETSRPRYMKGSATEVLGSANRRGYQHWIDTSPFTG